MGVCSGRWGNGGGVDLGNDGINDGDGCGIYEGGGLKGVDDSLELESIVTEYTASTLTPRIILAIVEFFSSGSNAFCTRKASA